MAKSGNLQKDDKFLAAELDNIRNLINGHRRLLYAIGRL